MRGAEALATLPERERREWQSLGDEVETFRKRGAGFADAAPAAPQLVPPKGRLQNLKRRGNEKRLGGVRYPRRSSGQPHCSEVAFSSSTFRPPGLKRNRE